MLMLTSYVCMSVSMCVCKYVCLSKGGGVGGWGGGIAVLTEDIV